MSAATNIVQFPGSINLGGVTESPSEPQGAQLENGYTRIANELLDAIIQAPLSSRELRVTLAVIRQTYGWNRKSARITKGLLASITKIAANKASETLSSLIKKKIVLRNGSSRAPVKINKAVSQWQLEDDETSENQETPKQGQRPQAGVSHRPQSGVSYKDTKDNNDLSKDKSCVENSENNQSSPSGETNMRPDAAVQTSNGKKWGTADDLANARYMADTVAKLQGADKSVKTDQELVGWADDCRLLRGMKTNSGKAIESQHIKALWDFAHRDQFWQRNLLSPKSLRKHWERLAVQHQQQRNPVKSTQQNSNGRPAYITDFSEVDYGESDLPDWALGLED